MSSDSESDEEVQSWKGVSGTIVLINAYDPLNSNSAERSHKATLEVMRDFMRTNSSQLLGVYFYGTNETFPSTLEIEGFIEVFPLTLPTLDDYKKLQDIKYKNHGQCKDFQMSEVLWHCSKMFANSKKLLSNKTILMLSRLDLPPIKTDQKAALKKAVDLVESDIKVKIINVAENPYNFHEFYEDFLIKLNKGNDFKVPLPVWNYVDIANMMHQHSHRHLAVARLMFEIAEGFSIGVGVYNLKKSQTKPKKYKADRDTNQIVTTVTNCYKVTCNENLNTAMDIDENETTSKEVPLLKSEVLYYQEFGDLKVEFTHEEMKNLKNPFGPSKLKLLGFKPEALLCKEKWFLKGCHFLYPNEAVVEGSTVAFKALHQACTEMSVVAICVLGMRINAKPAIVALAPCTNPLGLNVKIGFDVIHIPFVENVRNVPSNEEIDKSIDEASLLYLRDLVKGLEFNFHSNMFESPTLHSLYNAVEALALDKEEVEETHDTTRRNPAVYQNIDTELFHELFGPFGATATKRPTTSSANGSSKKEKIESIDECLLESRVENGQVEKYTVADLNNILKYKSIPNLPALTALKKNDLVQLVYQNLRK